MRKTLFLAALPAIMAASILAGCVPPQNADVTQLDPKTGQPIPAAETAAAMLKAFPDVPIPATHKIDLEHSMVFTAPNQTLGKITTIGSGDVDSVYHFFATKMPENGWHLVNSFQSGTSSLYFAKPGRFVAIIIESEGRNSTRVSMNIGPE